MSLDHNKAPMVTLRDSRTFTSAQPFLYLLVTTFPSPRPSPNTASCPEDLASTFLQLCLALATARSVTIARPVSVPACLCRIVRQSVMQVLCQWMAATVLRAPT